MAKTADFYVSGVWKDSSERITHVMLHVVNNDNTFQTKGSKTQKDVLINALKLGRTAKTIIWDYPGWEVGALITYEKRNNEEFLITVRDATKRNNLDNSLKMECFLN